MSEIDQKMTWKFNSFNVKLQKIQFFKLIDT